MYVGLFLTSSNILDKYAPKIPKNIRINPPINVINTIKSVYPTGILSGETNLFIIAKKP